MTQGRTHHRTHLFTLRMWAEDLGEDRLEWRAQVRHVLSGETHYFRRWSELWDFVQACLPEWDMADNGVEGGDESDK